MSYFHDLSSELGNLIAEKLYDEAHPALPLKALSLVCHHFHKISSSLLFRHVTITLTTKDPERCTAFLQFLHNKAEIRSSIRYITIPVQRFGFHGYHRDLNDSFKRLLPLLPRLQHVRIGGDESYGLYDWIDLRPIDPSILSAIDKLDRAVHLAVDCYVHTMNSEAQLGKLSCLTSLRVCILHETRVPTHERSMLEFLGSNPSQDVDKIISNNPRLKRLHINLHRASGLNDHAMYSETKDHALEIIGRDIPALHSLALEGDLRFTGKALETWTYNLNRLQSLSIIGVPFIEEMTKRLQGQLPMLQALTLSSFKDIQTKTTFQADPATIKAFLSTLTLTHLSLLGFQPDILLHAVQSSAASLCNLRLHIRENTMDLRMRAGPPLSTLLLSAEHLKIVKAACPSLESLTVDVFRSSLLAAEEDRQDASSSITSGPPTAAATITLDSSPSTDFSILTTLLAMRSLRKIRIFVKTDHLQPKTSSLTTADVMATYAYVRSHKRGCCMQNLVICTEKQGGYERWDVWELGPRMATVKYRQGWTWVKEVWDMEDMGVRRREGGEDRTRDSRPVWGLTEGW